jgi:hypothetical protein
MIGSYTYGKMVVKGQTYSSDLIIYPNRVDNNWRRKKGHQVCIDDIAEVIAGHPEYLIIGTGESGQMQVLAETQDFVRTCGIQLVFAPTEYASKLYNDIYAKRRVIGAFHLAG